MSKTFKISLNNDKILNIVRGKGWYISNSEKLDDENVNLGSGLIRELDWNIYLSSYNIYINANCNGKCIYCYQEAQNKRTFSNLSFDEIKSFINYMESLNKDLNLPKSIEFFGGEPLLRKDILKIIDFILSKGYKINIATNGTLPIIRSNSMLEYIKNPNVHFRISLDGHTKELHEKFRTKNSFNKILENINYLVS